jgi:hypothetical protein
MSRQNQALQVAVIIFAMSAIVLGVTNFLCLRRCDDLRAQAAAAQQDADRVAALAQRAQDEARELKRLMGFADDQKLAAVREQAAQDLQPIAAALPEGGRSYRAALLALHDIASDRGSEVLQQKGDIRSWAKKFEGRQRAGDAVALVFRKAVKEANTATVAAERNAAEALARTKEQFQALEKRLDQTRQEARVAAAAAQKDLQELQKAYKDLLAENERLRKERDEAMRDDFQQAAAHGQIRHVSAKLRKAWIDLGSADAVKPQLPFNVYPADVGRLARATQKGKIEVSQVVEAHLAEAKIVDDKPADPIVPGDKVHSPQWKRGRDVGLPATRD